MQMEQVDRSELDQLANRLERALRTARVPARIHGGESLPDRVRYHLAPQSDSLEKQLKAAVDSVAEQVGLPEVRVIRERAELALEVYTPGLRLLPLLDLIEESGVVLGMRPDGRPYLFEWNWANVLISGRAGCGKSELLRTFLLSAALAYSPADLRLIGIDFSARELSFLDSLPHALADVITHPEDALRMLDWLMRTSEGHVALAVDEVNLAPEGFGGPMLRRLERLGRLPGVSVLLTSDRSLRPAGWVELRGAARGEFRTGGGTAFSAAYVPARDLSRAILERLQAVEGG